MLPTARRAVTWRTEHSRRTMVETLDFVTAAGGMHGVVTPIAVFMKRDGKLALASGTRRDLDDVRVRTGFAFEAAGAGRRPRPRSARSRRSPPSTRRELRARRDNPTALKQ